ncbi:iron-containing alcohol dehydrogenase [Boseongicola sp. H5]|uniref:iron-containing alcohol dehydrogenase n=1 Tax=Boseongicola sp. H5 TaxID=2763261 RepID=UPI001D0A7410|nr:iron-containing alcohol dehydrogenase [Boseongicola sp. H5]
MTAFEYSPQPTRVVFGADAAAALPREAERLGLSRLLLLSTPGQSELARRAARDLGSRVVGHFDEAVMHTPVTVSNQAADQARDLGADALVSVGGGSTTGLGKAVARRTGLPHIVVPTTYAGSEMTPILGETEGGRKTTLRDASLLPETVIYDVGLTRSLPVGVTVASAMNAMAHAVEALYAADRNPVTDMLAVDAIDRFSNALPALVGDPGNLDARADALRAAWACGICLGQVSMGLHHKLCHVLGGTFGLPHAKTHAAILPHATAFNEQAVPELLAPVAEILGGASAGAALHEFGARLGAPTALRSLGLPKDAIVEAARVATENAYANPRGVDQDSIAGLLERAWAGDPPAGTAEEGYFTERNSARIVTARNEATNVRLGQVMEAITRHLHGAVKEIEPTQDEWMQAIQFLTKTGHACNDWRQEFILLSDVLGVSMLVDAINNRKPTGASESTVLGPFHVDGAPELEMGADICLDQKGEPMLVRGRILDTAGKPVNGAKIDVWQANDEGFYDVQQKGFQPEFNLRGVFRTGDDGQYWFRGVKPKNYPIPDDGPVGQLLKKLGRHPYRPAHLHYIIEAAGYEALITHIFDPDDPYIHSDAVFGVKESLLASFRLIEDADAVEQSGLSGPFYLVEHDFVLAPTR